MGNCIRSNRPRRYCQESLPDLYAPKTIPYNNYSTSSPISSQPTRFDYGSQGYTSTNAVALYPTTDYAAERAREESEQQRRRAESRAKSQERQRQLMQQIEDENKFDSIQWKRRLDEQNRRTNDLINAARYENSEKDRRANLDNEREIKRIRDEGRFDSEDYHRQLSDIHARIHESESRFRDNEYRYQQEDLERERETQRARQEQNERRNRIDEEFARKLEQLNQEAERKRREMDRQRDEIQEMMKRAVWTAVIERNWTNRLNSLRNANQASKRLEYRCLKPNASASDIEEWKETLNILQRVMRDESSNMTIMYNNTGKSFLLEIKSAVDLVAQNCAVLLRGLPSATSGSGQLSELVKELNRSCMAIPSLAELKRNYNAEMRNNSNI